MTDPATIKHPPKPPVPSADEAPRAELAYQGFWFRWSTLTRRDKRDILVSMILMVVGGGLTGGVHRHLAESGHPAGVVAAILIGCGVAMVALGTGFYIRFTMRQDELFRTIHAWGCIGAALTGFLVVITLIFFETMLPAGLPVSHIVLNAMGIGGTVGTVWAYRRYT